jgi:hypothetical protein
VSEEANKDDGSQSFSSSDLWMQEHYHYHHRLHCGMLAHNIELCKACKFVALHAKLLFGVTESYVFAARLPFDALLISHSC